MNPWADIEPVAGSSATRTSSAPTRRACSLPLRYAQSEGIDVAAVAWLGRAKGGRAGRALRAQSSVRAGEIMGLTERDVGAGELCVTEGKTANAARRVKVPEPLVRLLEDRARAVRERGGDRLL
jgi:integrase